MSLGSGWFKQEYYACVFRR